MTFQSLEAILCSCILDSASEEIDALLSTLGCKYGLYDDANKERIENEKAAMVLDRAAVMLERYGSINFSKHRLVKKRDRYLNENFDNSDYLYTKKVIKRMSKIRNVFSCCSREIQERGTFECLKKFVDDSTLKVAKLISVYKSHLEIENKLHEVQSKISTFQEENERILNKRENFIQVLNDRLQELKVKVAMETKFWFNNVEIAVSEKLNRLQNKEAELTRRIKQTTEGVANETRIHSEINAWLIDNNARLEAKIEYVMKKHHTAYTALQKANAALAKKRNEQMNTLKALIYEYKKVEAVVSEHKYNLEAINQKEEQEEKLNAAVISIQAWWRAMITKNKIHIVKAKKKGKRKKSDLPKFN